MPKLKAALKRQQQREKYVEKQKKLTEIQETELKGIRSRVSGSRKNKNQPKKIWLPLAHRPTKVLLVGEGDFSFSKSILEEDMVGSAICTSLDSEQVVRAKYPSSHLVLDWLKSADAVEHKTSNSSKQDDAQDDQDDHYDSSSDEEYLSANEEFEPSTSEPRAELIYEIDGTALHKYKSLKKYAHSLDMVIFNFPHLGNSVRDQERNILQHQKLMVAFFESAKRMINDNGSIMVSLFEGEPYISWDIKKLAKSVGLETLQSGSFMWEAYPGYHHCLTAKHGETKKPQASRAARSYLFKVKD